MNKITKKETNKNKKIKLIFLFFLVIIIILCIIIPILVINNNKENNSNNEQKQEETKEIIEEKEEEKEIINETISLFDIGYINDPTQTYVGYGTLKTNINIDGTKISLKINDQQQYFDEGYCAHAISQITFDISKYSSTYKRVTGYFGIDFAKGSNGDGATLKIYLSDDGINYNLIDTSSTQKGDNEAYKIDVDLYDANYIRFVADKNANDGYDHVVYTDLKLNSLGNTIYEEIDKLDTYDANLSKYSITFNYTYNKYEILKREFVNRVGYYNIQSLVKDNEAMIETLDWLIGNKDDYENLSLFIEAGTMINGDPKRTLNSLNSLYQTYKEDTVNTNKIYKKMMIATAVANCKSIVSWVAAYGGDTTESLPILKYKAMKYLYDNNYFNDKEQFENYSMELIRYVMDARLQDDEIIWLNRYVDDKFKDNSNGKFNGYSYISYVNTNAAKSEYYDLANKDKYNEKYHLDYGDESLLDSYGTSGRVRIWMRMEAGGVCWAISGCGTTVNEVFGIAATNIYQSGHEAYLLYKENENKDGYWEIWNNISGWQGSYTRWGGRVDSEVRLLLGWGNKSYNNLNKNNASYIILAQNALNNYQNYYDSSIYNYLSNSYSNTKDKINCFNRALNYLDTNLDSFDGLIDSYSSLNANDEEWISLAKQIVNSYKYYPLAMQEALNRIKNNVSENNKAYIDLLINNALLESSKVSNSEHIQAGACRDVANNLLNNSNTELASFSFSGENKNKIIINSSYDSYNFVIKYSLDGGNTFKTTDSHVISLTNEELNSINSSDDIKVGIVGSDDLFIIDILDGNTISTKEVILDDEENRLVGNSSNLTNLEYSLDNGLNFYDYTLETYFEGDLEVLVRYKSYDCYLLGNTLSYAFNLDSTDLTKQYVNSSKISCVETSSNQGGLEGKNAIDPNPNIGFHTKYGYSDPNKYIILKLDSAKYISMISYEAISANGRIKNAEILTSIDNENWIVSGTITSNPNTNQTSYFDLDNITYCQYIKIHVLDSYGNTSGEINMYFSARRIKLYEDLTIV